MIDGFRGGFDESGAGLLTGLFSDAGPSTFFADALAFGAGGFACGGGGGLIFALGSRVDGGGGGGNFTLLGAGAVEAGVALAAATAAPSGRTAGMREVESTRVGGTEAASSACE